MIRLGYHPAHWMRFPDGSPRGSHEECFPRALREMAAAGWQGVELAGPWYERFYDDPAGFRRMLADHGLELVTYYYARSLTDPATIDDDLDGARRRCAFIKAAGGELLLINVRDGHPERDAGEARRVLAEKANAMGRLAREEFGMAAVWHQHWNTVLERPGPFDEFMARTDPDLVGFCPDTAHLTRGGFDLEPTFRRYLDRIRYVHFKDITSDERYVELGRGTVDFPPLWELLRSSGYDGWITIDLDYTELEPAESARVNHAYLTGTLGIGGRTAAQ